MIKKTLFIILILQWLPALAASDAISYVKLVELEKGFAPALELSNISEEPETFNDYHDRITVVHFWATWCPPCIKELPELQAFYGKFIGKGLHLLTVATDSHDSVSEFLKNNSMNFNVVVDQYGSAMHDFQVNALPSSYIVNKNGELQLLAQGPVDWSSNETEQLIESLIAQSSN